MNLKEILKLEQKKYRLFHKKYLIFGEHLVKEAYLQKQLIMIIVPENDPKLLEQKFFDIPLKKIDKKDFQKFKTTTTTPNIIGICAIIEQQLTRESIIALNKINDPGNMGTIIRSAKAFGINNILIDKHSVDIYNPKVIQAMQGANFSMNLQIADVYEYCKKSNNSIITTFLDEEANNKEVLELKNNDKLNNFILIIGNEAQGIEEKFKKIKHFNYKIKISYESLNAAIAASIIMYELTKKERNDR